MRHCAQGHFIPEDKLTCPECATARGEEAFHSLQLEFLRKAADGEHNYTLRVAKGPDRHVLMYTSWVRTFCGQELKTKPQIAYEALDANALSRVCAGCRIEITRALQEVS
jgi:hypothetical protein